jgi:hypothetical protein
LRDDQLLSFHNQLTDLEDDLLTAISQQPSTPEFVVTTFLTFVPRFKEVVELIVPDSKPLLLFFAEYPESVFKSQPGPLRGFDDVFGSVMMADEIRRHEQASGRVPYKVTIQDSDAREWMRLNRFTSIIAIPIRACVSGTVDIVGYMTVVLNRDCEAMTYSALSSILRRFGLLYEQTMYMAQIEEPIEDPAAD